MRIQLEIPEYVCDGIDVFWDKNASYKLYVDGDSVHLVANTEGLVSFAKQMLYLAQAKVPDGSHVHFDQFFTQQSDIPFEFVIAKKDCYK